VSSAWTGASSAPLRHATRDAAHTAGHRWPQRPRRTGPPPSRLRRAGISAPRPLSWSAGSDPKVQSKDPPTHRVLRAHEFQWAHKTLGIHRIPRVRKVLRAFEVRWLRKVLRVHEVLQAREVQGVQRYRRRYRVWRAVGRRQRNYGRSQYRTHPLACASVHNYRRYAWRAHHPLGSPPMAARPTPNDGGEYHPTLRLRLVAYRYFFCYLPVLPGRPLLRHHLIFDFQSLIIDLRAGPLGELVVNYARLLARPRGKYRGISSGSWDSSRVGPLGLFRRHLACCGVGDPGQEEWPPAPPGRCSRPASTAR
jgi:hypothetical protein